MCVYIYIQYIYVCMCIYSYTYMKYVYAYKYIFFIYITYRPKDPYIKLLYSVQDILLHSYAYWFCRHRSYRLN